MINETLINPPNPILNYSLYSILKMKKFLIISILTGLIGLPAFNQSIYNKFIPKGYWQETALEKIPAALQADAKKRMNQLKPGFDFSFYVYTDDAKNIKFEFGPFLTVVYNASGKWMESIKEASDEAYEKLIAMAEEQGYIYEEKEGVVTCYEYSNPAGSWYALDVENEDVEFYLLISNKAYKFIKMELNE